jgi:predicted nucleotidyltransferase
MTKQAVLEQLNKNLLTIQKRFGVRHLSIFGTVARDQTQPQSDVDILVSFEKPASFDTFMDLKFYLEDLFAASVDLVTEKAMRPEIRDSIEKELINVA